jgi:putative transposase
MIDRGHDLSITKQAEILKVSRGSVYYLPRPVSSADLDIMQRLDRLHLEFPFAGSRMLRGLLALQGYKIGRRHVKTLMRRMGIEALYRRPRTTKPEPGHKIYPYLLRGMEITRPNQVWAMDITYIPMARGFVYLAVVLDWATRRVMSWRLSITMEAAFCVETLEDALARHGRRTSSTPTRARNLPARPSPACSPAMASPSAWTAKGPGETMCSSNGCGAASNMRRSICGPTKPSARRDIRSADTSTFTMADVLIRVLTSALRIKPTSIFRRSARRPNPGRGSTYRRGESVQTTGTSSGEAAAERPQRLRWALPRSFDISALALGCDFSIFDLRIADTCSPCAHRTYKFFT